MVLLFPFACLSYHHLTALLENKHIFGFEFVADTFASGYLALYYTHAESALLVWGSVLGVPCSRGGFCLPHVDEEILALEDEKNMKTESILSTQLPKNVR